MSVAIGDVVIFKGAGKGAELGRVCKDNGFTVCVQFRYTGCLRVSKEDLELSKGKAPKCSDACSNGC